MAISIIPGQTIKTVCSGTPYLGADQHDSLGHLHQATGTAIRTTLVKWVKRAPRPAFSAAIFFAIAF